MNTQSHNLVLPSQMQRNQPTLPSREPEREYDLLDIWKVLRRRRRELLITILAALVLGGIYCIFAPRLYRADAKLQLLKQSPAADLSEQSAAEASGVSDALDFNLALQTQVDILKSNTLALRVFHELKLEDSPALRLKRDPGEAGLPFDKAPKRMAYALKQFHKNLAVDAVAGTRLISVSYLDRDPARAAQVVNQLLADYTTYNFQVRYTATTKAAGLLGDELKSMKSQVEHSQADVARLQQQSGIYGVDESNNAVNAKLEQLNTELTQAQATRVVKESIYRLAKSRDPEALAGLVGSQAAGGNPNPTPLQHLRQEESDDAATYAELNAHYGPEYPKVIQAGERLKSVQASIQGEMTKVVSQARAEYEVAANTEAAASKALDQQKALAAQMNLKASEYTTAKHESDSHRDLYERMVTKLTEAGVLAGLRSSDINILDPAQVPDKPAKPSIPLYMAIALLAGSLLGLIVAFIMEAMDVSVRDPQQLEEALGAPILGMIPAADLALPSSAQQLLRQSIDNPEWSYQTTARAPRSGVAEAFRALRTSVLCTMPNQSLKVLEITSTTESEGKSFTTFNLAAAFAQSGKTVLVMDADMRKGTLSRALGLQTRAGLSSAVNSASYEAYIEPHPGVPGLSVMPAGECPPYPAELLGSPGMSEMLRELRKKFDFILIDTPSVLPVTDAVSLAGFVDAVILVAKFGKSARHSLYRTWQLLSRSSVRCLGIVINGVNLKSSDYYYYWGEYGRSYEAEPTQLVTAPVQASASGRTWSSVLLLFAGLLMLTAGAAPSARAQAVKGPLPASGVQEQSLTIAPGDLLQISVYDAPELTQEVRVSSDGKVNLLLLGELAVANMRAEQASQTIENQLKGRKFIAKPHVSVTIKEFTTRGVTLEGEVKNPGVYPIYAPRNLVDVIAMASGLTAQADTHVTIRRHDTHKSESVTLPQNDASAVLRNDVEVYPGDIIVVPRAGIVYVVGDVVRPGEYIMRDNGGMTVVQAISEAQGTAKTASLNKAVLVRKGAAGPTRTPLQLKQIMKGEAPDVKLESGDIVFVPDSAFKNFEQSTQGIVASVSGAAVYGIK